MLSYTAQEARELTDKTLSDRALLERNEELMAAINRGIINAAGSGKYYTVLDFEQLINFYSQGIRNPSKLLYIILLYLRSRGYQLSRRNNFEYRISWQSQGE